MGVFRAEHELNQAASCPCAVSDSLSVDQAGRVI